MKAFVMSFPAFVSRAVGSVLEIACGGAVLGGVRSSMVFGPRSAIDSSSSFVGSKIAGLFGIAKHVSFLVTMSVAAVLVAAGHHLVTRVCPAPAK